MLSTIQPIGSRPERPPQRCVAGHREGHAVDEHGHHQRRQQVWRPRPHGPSGAGSPDRPASPPPAAQPAAWTAPCCPGVVDLLPEHRPSKDRGWNGARCCALGAAGRAVKKPDGAGARERFSRVQLPFRRAKSSASRRAAHSQRARVPGFQHRNGGAATPPCAATTRTSRPLASQAARQRPAGQRDAASRPAAASSMSVVELRAFARRFRSTSPAARNQVPQGSSAGCG